MPITKPIRKDSPSIYGAGESVADSRRAKATSDLDCYRIPTDVLLMLNHKSRLKGQCNVRSTG
jgi:hypothetical protein